MYVPSAYKPYTFWWPPLDASTGGRGLIDNWSAFITARKWSLGQGNIFTRVCHSVHSGVCFWGVSLWEGVPCSFRRGIYLLGDGVCLVEGLPTGGFTSPKTRKTDGTHPSGMLSLLKLSLPRTLFTFLCGLKRISCGPLLSNAFHLMENQLKSINM